MHPDLVFLSIIDLHADMVRVQQDDVAAAKPEIDERTAQLVSKGRWSVPGYKVWGSLEIAMDFTMSTGLTGYTGKIRESFGLVVRGSSWFPEWHFFCLYTCIVLESKLSLEIRKP